MNHSMRLAIFNHFSHFKLLVVLDTRFASAIVTMRRFQFLKCSLQSMVIAVLSRKKLWRSHGEKQWRIFNLPPKHGDGDAGFSW